MMYTGPAGQDGNPDPGTFDWAVKPRPCDVEFGPHDHDDNQCAAILANMRPHPSIDPVYDEHAPQEAR